jgi:hypothetical protein
VHHADPRAGQHGNRGLGNIRQINDYPIALFDIVPFQYIREAANFPMQLLVGERAFVARLAFPDNCRLVSTRPAQMPIETILRDVEFPADEPLRERRLPLENFFPWRAPDQLTRFARPEFLPAAGSIPGTSADIDLDF